MDIQKSILPSCEALKHGFSQIPDSYGKKALLFVVTVNEGNTAENLEKNLYNTLIEFRYVCRRRSAFL